MKKSRLDISLNVVFAILFVVLLIVFCITAKTFATSSGYSVTPVTLTGEYTTDKGDTFKLDSDHPFLNNNYKSITFKGKINAYVIPRHIVNLIMAVKKNYDEQLNYEKVQSELLKSRVTIMISQIQPHFLYNSLTSIAQLCEKDPKRAKTATIDFANYLRGNMNSIKDEHPVPFETELSHLKTYLSLEKMRFGDDLNIVYDIGVTDFTIPSLTVQPLVENAVKHGVGMKEDGGTVTISTKEYDDRYKVVVSDDGVGFDTTKPNPDTSRH